MIAKVEHHLGELFPRVGFIIITTLTGTNRAVVLCLPFIRLIGSRRAPQVLMMKPTNARDAYHPALARLLHSTRLG